MRLNVFHTRTRRCLSSGGKNSPLEHFSSLRCSSKMTSYMRGGALAMSPSMVAPSGEKLLQLGYAGASLGGVSGQLVVDKCGPVNMGKRCQVCGEKASGNFFGALVCLPCKVRVCDFTLRVHPNPGTPISSRYHMYHKCRLTGCRSAA